MPHKLGVSTEECFNNVTLMILDNNILYQDESDVFPLYRLSFHWINPIGIVTVLIVGTIVSYFTGPKELVNVDPQLISPVIHR